MPSGFRLEVNDYKFNKMLTKLKQTVDETSATVDRELAASGEDMVRSAKNILSSRGAVDTGRLLNSISFKKDQFLSYQFVAQTDYAAYIEFGTGNLFVNPERQGWVDLAAKYKGKGIKKVNLPPRPYMRPSILAYWPIYQKRVRDFLRKKRQA
ncbi:MAG: HK97 gp10 family phage protein [Sphingomonadaceae bacterium]|jgi:hypothetical protein|nr:HK97 gp10 family phage protein [Sphingomonadaceae bacterium]